MEVLLDTLYDGIRLLPFLFLTYLLMEILEHKQGSQLSNKVRNAGKYGPIVGGILGVIPQCGFSTAAASLYSGGVITVGTLLSIFLSTSDEMLPILISEAVDVRIILKILGAKVIIAVVSGLIVELVYVYILGRREKDMDIHVVCEEEKCNCEDGAFLSAIKHTIKIFIYIMLISLALNVLIHFIGEDSLGNVLSSVPVLGEVLAAVIGLIPNCASSVVLTKLYLDGIINAGAMMSGLLVNAGVGMLVLFRLNRNIKQNTGIMATLYGIGVFWGIIIEIIGIV